MRHRKQAVKLGRTSSHRKALMSSLLKSLVDQGAITTTVAKAKELRRHADRLVTLAKKRSLSSKRLIASRLRLQYNTLTGKQRKQVKLGDTSSYNTDRRIFGKLDELATRFEGRNGGYTRIVRTHIRVGDQAPLCVIEYVEGASAPAATPAKKAEEKAPKTTKKVEENKATPAAEDKVEEKKPSTSAAPKEEKKEVKASAKKETKKKSPSPKKTEKSEE